MQNILAAILVILSTGLAAAETEYSVYGGVQSAPHSGVRGTDPGGIGAFDFTAGWEGRSLDMPPYYGLRVTWWRSATFGWGLEFNHTKVYADEETLTDNGLSRLEFSDGLNFVTVNGYRRWPDQWGRFTPYVGAGIGASVPHVEFDSGAGETFEYQLTGAVVTWLAGVKYPINDRWNVFSEYKGTYSMNNADLVSGGTLETNIITNALNFGVGISF